MSSGGPCEQSGNHSGKLSSVAGHGLFHTERCPFARLQDDQGSVRLDLKVWQLGRVEHFKRRPVSIPRLRENREAPAQPALAFRQIKFDINDSGRIRYTQLELNRLNALRSDKTGRARHKCRFTYVAQGAFCWKWCHRYTPVLFAPDSNLDPPRPAQHQDIPDRALPLPFAPVTKFV